MEREKTIKYVITQDTMGIFKEITQNDNVELMDVGKLSDGYFQQIRDVLERTYQGSNIEIEAYLESDINTQLNSTIAREMAGNPKLTCVCLDRFLLKEIECQFPERFSRIGITRDVSGRKSARQGCFSPEKQFEQVAQKIGDSSIIIADDGIFTGGTIEYSIDTLRKFGANGRIVKIVGFIGDDNLTNLRDVPVEIISPTNALYEWVDIRDFSIFGGKKYETSKSNRVTSAVPYIFPWSDGSGASFDRLGCFFKISKEMIASFQELVKGYVQSTGRQLVVQDLVRAGFPLPANKDKTIPISLKMNVAEYLDMCVALVEKEEKRKVAVFDMDGTLYQLNGENGGYKGSTLEKRVIENAISYVGCLDNCSPEKAKQIVEEGLKNPIGLSAFCSKRYDIARKDYFDNVWNINPEGVVFNFQTAVDTVRRLSQTDAKLVLLTGAGKAWQEQVVRYLGLEDVFKIIYTAEDFSDKAEIFEMLAERYSPSRVISIGDQDSTDIYPALRKGLKVLKVDKPSGVEKITEILESI